MTLVADEVVREPRPQGRIRRRDAAEVSQLADLGCGGVRDSREIGLRSSALQSLLVGLLMLVRHEVLSLAQP